MKFNDHVTPNEGDAPFLPTVRKACRHGLLQDFVIDQALLRSGYRLLRDLFHFLTCMRFSRILLALVVATAMGKFPSFAHAEAKYELWAPCALAGKATSEGRYTYIGGYLNAKTTGMRTTEIEDLYCVTYVKCVALGFCPATSPAEQAAADKLKREAAVERARLEREGQARAAQAERARKKAQAAAAAEKARREKLAAAEAKRHRLSVPEAKRLVDARENARKKMPAPPEKCTVVSPAYEKKVDFTPLIFLKFKAEKDHAALDRSKVCNGHPGKLGPLQCTNQASFFGLEFASCSAVLSCPERKENKRCNPASVQ